MSKVQNFTSTSRHLATEKPLKMRRFGQSHLKSKAGKPLPRLTAVCLPAKPLGGPAQGLGAGPCIRSRRSSRPEGDE